MKKTCIGVLLCGLLLFMSSVGVAEELTKYLPTSDELPGWKAEDAPQHAKGDELFSLINGAAEVYFEYGFVRSLLQYYVNDQEQSLQIEVYEMTDAAAAYGIFSFHAGNEGKPIAIGNDGIVGEYYLSFWQGAFFVMLSVSESEPEFVEILEQTAQKIASKLPPGGERPALATRFLTQQAAPLAVKYIKGALGLFNLTSFDANVTNGFDEGAIADYEEFEVALLRYRDEQALAVSFEATRNTFKADAAIRDFRADTQSFFFTDKDGTPIYGAARQTFFCLMSRKEQQAAAEFCQMIIATQGK